MPNETTKETMKTTQIRDVFGNLRFEVQLKTTDLWLHESETVYEVQVINFHYAPDPLVILTKQTEVYGFALSFYDECVRNYTNLIKAETRDFQDISLYKDKIGYKLTCPKCCATCLWCRRRPLKKEFTFGATFKLECWNEKNSTAYDFDMKDDCRHDYDMHYRDGHKHHLDIHPNVKAFGVCDNYELRTTPYIPVPGDKLTRFIDRRIENKVSAVISAAISLDIKPIVDQEISNQLSSTIIPEVGRAIEQQLSVCPPIIEGNKYINDYNNDGIVNEADELVIGCDLGA